MRGKGHKRAAEQAYKRWQKLHFDGLCSDRVMPTPMHATLQLPVHTASAVATTSTTPSLRLQLATNHKDIAAWWRNEYGSFLRAEDNRIDDHDASGASPVATARVLSHVGAPAAPLGYPEYLNKEATQWTDGVLRGEAYAYERAGQANPAASPAGSPYLSPVRWLRQPLLDGVVAQRVTAHTGVTTAALLQTRRTAAALGRPLRPHAVSSYFGVNTLLDKWCLFGEPDQLVPAGSEDVTENAPAAQHRRVAELAMAAAVLPNYDAAWLNGAVLANAETGRFVFLAGSRHSGKTTLALHVLAAAANDGAATASPLRLIAAEHFFVGAGSPVRRTLAGGISDSAAAPQFFVSSLPHRLHVGIGAVLGTLRANPALAPAVELPPVLRSEAGMRAFLANSDAAIWGMGLRFPVRLQDLTDGPTWQPAVLYGLAGVVLLDWDVAELAKTTPQSVQTRLRSTPLHDGGLDLLVHHGRDYLFRGHQLIRPVYDGAVDGAARLARAFAAEWAAHPPTSASAAAPSLHTISGSVDFDGATQLVKELLMA